MLFCKIDFSYLDVPLFIDSLKAGLLTQLEAAALIFPI